MKNQLHQKINIYIGKKQTTVLLNHILIKLYAKIYFEPLTYEYLNTKKSKETKFILKQLSKMLTKEIEEDEMIDIETSKSLDMSMKSTVESILIEKIQRKYMNVHNQLLSCSEDYKHQRETNRDLLEEIVS